MALISSSQLTGFFDANQIAQRFDPAQPFAQILNGCSCFARSSSRFFRFGHRYFLQNSYVNQIS